MSCCEFIKSKLKSGGIRLKVEMRNDRRAMVCLVNFLLIRQTCISGFKSLIIMLDRISR